MSRKILTFLFFLFIMVDYYENKQIKATALQY